MLGTITRAIKMALGAKVLSDEVCVASVTAPAATGGATDTTLTIQLYMADGETPIRAEREFIFAASTLRLIINNPKNTVTFGAAATTGKGTLVYRTSGYFVGRTNSAGLFEIVMSNSADETLYCMAVSPQGVSSTAYGCTIIGSNERSVTWSA